MNVRLPYFLNTLKILEFFHVQEIDCYDIIKRDESVVEIDNHSLKIISLTNSHKIFLSIINSDPVDFPIFFMNWVLGNDVTLKIHPEKTKINKRTFIHSDTPQKRFL